MPKRYEAIRDNLRKNGVLKKKAQKKAAKIHNATKKPSESAAGKKTPKTRKKPQPRMYDSLWRMGKRK